MTPRPRRLLVGCLALVAFAGSLLAASSPPAAGEKKAAPGKLITFKAHVIPADPFSDENQVSAEEGKAGGRAFVRGKTVTLVIEGIPAEGYHTYPLSRRTSEQDEASLSSLKYTPNPALTPLYPVRETEGEFYDTQVDGVWLEHAKPFYWSQDVLIQPDASPGKTTLKAEARAQVCDERGCTWVMTPLEVPIEISDAAAAALEPELAKRLEANKPAPIEVVAVPEGVRGKPAPAGVAEGPREGGTSAAAAGAPPSQGGMSLWAFVLQGIFWGGVSLITPCVFPMIPITVSFFLKQSERKQNSAVLMAVVYSATIVIVLTIAAVALLSFFRALSVNPVMNFGLGLLFIFFALSLFGMYDIQLPSGLAQLTSSRESKGGLVGTIFMALTFTIISFACVAPFLGGFGGTAAGSAITLTHRVLGGLAFSITFASPFFFLALFPQLLKKMPQSGAWLNSVKVVMGFLELAAALKFFRAGEIVVRDPQLFTYELVLGLYVALSLLCGLYLLGIFRLPHDHDAPEHLGVPRMMLSFIFLGLGFYMMPGMFRVYDARGERLLPQGAVYAWIDSFLLPDTTTETVTVRDELADLLRSSGAAGKGGAVEDTRLVWQANLRKALEEARKKNQKVFVDFTGQSCTNCKINERTVFSREEVRSQLKKYVLVQLYTDRIPDAFFSSGDLGGSPGQANEAALKNLEFQREKFNTEQLPLYVILDPTSALPRAGDYQGASWLPEGGYDEVARYEEGKINNESAFLSFLRQPLGEKALTQR